MRRLLLLVLLAGCSEPGTEWDQAAIQRSFEAARLIVPAMNAADGVAASHAVSLFAFHTTRIITPSVMSELHADVVGLNELPMADSLVDDRRCSTGECAFKYEWTQTLYHSFAFTGTLTRTAETVAMSFTSSDRFRDLDSAESTVSGSVTATEDELAGFLSVHATASDKNALPEHQATAAFTIEFREVTFDSDLCGTGGTVTASLDYTGRGGARDSGQDSWDARFVLSGSDAVTCP